MVQTKSEQDQLLIEGLMNSDHKSIEKLYDLVLPSIIFWVKRNNGSETDGRDIFQEALLALFRKLKESKDEFHLTCTLKSYLFIICKNIWFTKLRDNRKYSSNQIGEVETVGLDDDMIERIHQLEKQQLFFKYFDLLGESCKQILQWYFDKVPMKEIAARMKTSESYVKKRKFVCKEKLVKAVRADEKYDELKR